MLLRRGNPAPTQAGTLHIHNDDTTCGGSNALYSWLHFQYAPKPLPLRLNRMFLATESAARRVTRDERRMTGIPMSSASVLGVRWHGRPVHDRWAMGELASIGSGPLGGNLLVLYCHVQAGCCIDPWARQRGPTVTWRGYGKNPADLARGCWGRFRQAYWHRRQAGPS